MTTETSEQGALKQAEARVAALEAALERIAGGYAPAEFVELSREAFYHNMWTWSQREAKASLAATPTPEGEKS